MSMTFIQGTASKTLTVAMCLAGNISHGISPDARYIATKQRQPHDHLTNSNAFGINAPVAVARLEQVFEECRQPNWDGYGASGVSTTTFLLARELLSALPLGTTPEFGADPDGDLTFEWHKSTTRTLSVSISPSGDLHYAAIIGARRYHGTEPFFLGEVPRGILGLIREVMDA